MAKKATAQVRVVSIESITSELVKNVTEQMNGAGLQLSPKTVMSVLKIAIEAVEGSPVKGSEQKDLAIKVVLEIATNAGLPEDQLTIIRALVDGGFVSDTIDLVIAASQGKLNINQVQEVAKGCFSACFKKRAVKNTEQKATPPQQPQQVQQQPQQAQQQPQQAQPTQPQVVNHTVVQPQVQPVLAPPQILNPQQPVTSAPMVTPTQVTITMTNVPASNEPVSLQQDVIDVPVQTPVPEQQESSNVPHVAVTEQM